MMMSDNATVYGAFMMEGLRDHCDKLGPSGYPMLLNAWGHGCFELISDMCGYANYFDEAMESYIRNDYGFPGVFEYEVCNPFGMWFAAYVLDKGYAPPRIEAKQHIHMLTHSFFTQ